MTVSRARAAGAALAFSALAVVGLQAPAAADHVCPNPAGHYPPGQCEVGRDNAGGVSDNTPTPGQPTRVQSRGHRPGSPASVQANSTPVFLGNFVADSAGVVTASVTLPVSMPVGRHHIVVTGIAPSGLPLVNSFPITITAANSQAAQQAAAGGAGGNTGAGVSVGGVQLPRTGGEIVAVTAAGIALVALGGAAIYAGRRRRMDGTIAA